MSDSEKIKLRIKIFDHKIYFDEANNYNRQQSMVAFETAVNSFIAKLGITNFKSMETQIQYHASWKNLNSSGGGSTAHPVVIIKYFEDF